MISNIIISVAIFTNSYSQTRFLVVLMIFLL